MLYLGNPCANDAIIAAMTARKIGMIATEAQGQAVPPNALWAGDNGKFGQGWRGRDVYLRWAQKMADVDGCLFMVAPDVPYDMAGTLAESAGYIDDLHELGYPVALALQNGAEHMSLPWGDYEAAFIGGDDKWKVSTAARDLATEARDLGKHVHMGRVTTKGRLRRAYEMGCDTADGTAFTFGPDKNLDRFLRWTAQFDRGVTLAMI